MYLPLILHNLGGTPVVHAAGQLDIPQTFTADLDEGVVGDSATADIWFQAVSAEERYIAPRNDARLALGGPAALGRDGCATAPLAPDRIPIQDLAVGTHVCVLTDEGRLSEFRVLAPVGPSPGLLRIEFTTWEAVPP